MSLTPQEQERLAYTHGGAEAELWRLMCEALEHAQRRDDEDDLTSGHATRELELGEEIEELKDRILFLESTLHDVEVELEQLRA